MKDSHEKKVTKHQDSGLGPGGKATKSVSFVIVLWLEPREVQAEPEWRWRVNHVQSGDQALFKRLDDVLAYVATKAEVSPPG